MEDIKISKTECQLQTLFEGTKNLTVIDTSWLIVVRVQSALLRRFEKLKKIVKNKSSKETRTNSVLEEAFDRNEKNPNLKAGDTVQILSMNEIKKILDKNNATEGLWFMPGMEKFCGMKGKVFKKVNYLFDERAWMMRKCKNVVILEGIICSGKGMFSKEGCDRSCYFFWKESWLRKL